MAQFQVPLADSTSETLRSASRALRGPERILERIPILLQESNQKEVLAPEKIIEWEPLRTRGLPLKRPLPILDLAQDLRLSLYLQREAYKLELSR